MRIVHIITRLIRGGADENTLLSCNGQAEMGHEVHLIYGAEVSTAMLSRLHPGVRPHQIRALRRPVTPLADVRATFATTTLLRQIRPHVVHTHTSKAGAIGRVAARIARIPAVVHGIHILPFMNVGRAGTSRLRDRGAPARPGHRCLRGRQPRHDGHRASRTASARRPGTPSSRAEWTSHGFAMRGLFLTSEIAGAFGCSEAEASQLKLLVMVAALEPRKRVEEFLDVFARIVAEPNPRRRWRSWVKGTSAMPSRDRIRVLGLQHRVALLGFRTDVERWVTRADVCVLTSEREGLPRAVVQYVLARRPVVVTALPGIDGVVRTAATASSCRRRSSR